jgi:hypothetical protein
VLGSCHFSNAGIYDQARIFWSAEPGTTNHRRLDGVRAAANTAVGTPFNLSLSVLKVPARSKIKVTLSQSR